MQRFFSSLSSLQAFTHSLSSLPGDNACRHCSKDDQWVSHGFVRKVRRGRVIATVGKRVFCSNRDSRQGCGRTQQLYLSSGIPNMHYSTLQVALFVTQLLAGCTVEDAYCEAVDNADARQAWRWVSRLTVKVGVFRRRVKPSFPLSAKPIPTHSRRLTVLLEPLQQLLKQGYDLSQYQSKHQEVLM
jgi:hypothetical protein